MKNSDHCQDCQLLYGQSERHCVCVAVCTVPARPMTVAPLLSFVSAMLYGGLMRTVRTAKPFSPAHFLGLVAHAHGQHVVIP